VDTEPFKEMVLPIVADLEEEGFWRKGLFDDIQKLQE
jgi:hypothetical protein